LNKRIGVIGCGWLGFPLAISLINQGYKVNGSTTSVEKIKLLDKEGILPFLLSLHEDGIKGDISNFLKSIELLIVNIPPKLRAGNKENYVKKIQLLHSEIKKHTIKHVIFVSSTSIYGDLEGEVTEETIPKPNTESGKQLLAAEKIFKNDSKVETTIIRFGGLIGPNRHPITMLSRRQELPNGNHPINLIHLNDCIRILTAVLQNSWWNEVFNGVYPEHPSKEKYYTTEAKKRGLQIPDYKTNNPKKGKKVLSKSLLNVKKFKFTTSL